MENTSRTHSSLRNAFRGTKCTLAENTACTTVHDRAVAVVRERPSIGGFGPEGGLRVAVAASRREGERGKSPLSVRHEIRYVARSHFVNQHFHAGPAESEVTGRPLRTCRSASRKERRFSCRMSPLPPQWSHFLTRDGTEIRRCPLPRPRQKS